MLLITMLIVFMLIEKLICYPLDVCEENRIINPILGVVGTLLVSSRMWTPRANIQSTHIVHILLCIVCIVYIRVMIGFVFDLFFVFFVNSDVVSG
jgi:hypothetical protein